VSAAAIPWRRFSRSTTLWHQARRDENLSRNEVFLADQTLSDIVDPAAVGLKAGEALLLAAVPIVVLGETACTAVLGQGKSCHDAFIRAAPGVG